jgi:flagellar basal-body rod protein FlgB
MNDKIDQALGTQSAALAMRVKRQQLIASNIANADTPGYKAVDIDFRRAMKSAVEQTKVAAAANDASGMQKSAFSGLDTRIPTFARVPSQAAADANTVDMDVERARFAENAVRYEAALKFLNGQIKTLLSAIQG